MVYTASVHRSFASTKSGGKSDGKSGSGGHFDSSAGPVRRLFRRRFIRWTLITGAAISVLAAGVVGGLWAYYPEIAAWGIRARVIPRLEARLNCDITVTDVQVGRGYVMLKDVVVSGDKVEPDPVHVPAHLPAHVSDSGSGDVANRASDTNGKGDGGELLRIQRVAVDFDEALLWRGELQLGDAMVEGVRVAIVRAADGRDNVSGLLAAAQRQFGGLLRHGGGSTAASASSPSPSSSLGGGGMARYISWHPPRSVTIRKAAFTVDDAAAGMRIAVAQMEGEVSRARAFRGQLAQIAIESKLGPRAEIGSAVVTTSLADPVGAAVIAVQEGLLSLRGDLSLSDISGTVKPGVTAPMRLDIDVSGSYAGAGEQLWQAKGWIDPVAQLAELDVVSEHFTFDRLHAILDKSAIVDYDKTALSADMHLALDGKKDGGTLHFAGRFDLADLDIAHPMLAQETVEGISISGQLEGHFTRSSRTLVLSRAALRSRDVDFVFEATVDLPGGKVDDNVVDKVVAPALEPEPEPASEPPIDTDVAVAGDVDGDQDGDGDGRRAHLRVAGRLVVPPVACQTVLDAIPSALVPYLAGYKMEGTFQSDVRFLIDWADLDTTELEGIVDIFSCVATEPKNSEVGVARLQESFVHQVELERDEWMEFTVGPENPDFVPFEDISSNIFNAFMTTEDTNFYEHQGFIAREFRTALIRNLEAGYFRFGASSITMQTVKNVMLYREKNLSRKLQELFLSWYLETQLEKERILEIYANAIEYGPGLYGIGPATRRYFGKPPSEINAVEAVFLASLLPSPKSRYRQYCGNRLWRKTEAKIDRVLKLMVERERLSEIEHMIAQYTPLEFDRTEAQPERACMKMVRLAIERARPTDPTAELAGDDEDLAAN